MIYATQQRAEQVAHALNTVWNERDGTEARAVLTADGWTVQRKTFWKTDP